MPNQKQTRRKNYFIKKKFQADFFGKFSALLLLEAVIIYALFMVISRGTLTAAYEPYGFILESTDRYFFGDMILIGILTGLAVAVIGAVVFMYLSHRIGGALYRFEKTLEGAKSGDFKQRPKLRSSDELQDLNVRMNEFLDSMDQEMRTIKKRVSEGIQRIEKQGKADKKTEEVRGLLKDLETSLNRFKTS